MVTVDVDFEVFKELTRRRRFERMTENEVIREALGLSKRPRVDQESPPTGGSWVVKGVDFPHGSEFRANYKGKLYSGVVNNGALVINGRRFSSLSAAAVSITHNPVNGWVFWECKFPGGSSWRTAKELRQRA
jgi:hypothetical protein